MNAPLLHSGTLFAQSLPEAGGLRLRLHLKMDDVESLWRNFEKQSVCTAYQSFDWCNCWVNRVGKAQDVSPLVVTGETLFGEIQFILPLQIRKRFGLSVIEALTAPLGAYAFGLFHPTFYETKAREWFERHLSDIVAILPVHDVFRLADIVEVVAGLRNPLLAAGSIKSANNCNIIDLKADFQSLYEVKRPGRRRRYLRNRDAKLEGMGVVTFALPVEDSAIRLTMQTMLDDQDRRLAEAGVRNVFSVEERQFFIDLALCKGQEGQLLKPFKLSLDDTVLAVISGLHFNSTFWAVISSLAAHEARKHSPGDYALRQTIRAMCEAGVRHYDFSVGDADYKSQWADHQLQLHCVTRASTMRGLAYAATMLIKEKAKRFVKRAPVLFSYVEFARRLLRGRAPK